jgi:alpha-D-ribose 1-methylphosphonate 5-triphosphate synthase subunit PhnG
VEAEDLAVESQLVALALDPALALATECGAKLLRGVELAQVDGVGSGGGPGFAIVDGQLGRIVVALKEGGRVDAGISDVSPGQLGKAECCIAMPTSVLQAKGRRGEEGEEGSADERHGRVKGVW